MCLFNLSKSKQIGNDLDSKTDIKKTYNGIYIDFLQIIESLLTINQNALLMLSRSQIELNDKYIVYICSNKIQWSNMALTLDLQISFKVTVHPLIAGILWVKYGLG